MKRLSNSKSFKDPDANLIIPLSSSSVQSRVKYEEKSQSFLVEEEEEEDELNGQLSPSSWLGEKKRRLGAEQVKALEKHFEVENKLDPERKVRLAGEIGLQPRQVAVWFQNRRARWKTKQLERDYGALKARHDSLKLDCDTLRTEKEALIAEIRELKVKITSTTMAVAAAEATMEMENRPAAALMQIIKDGASDSDSSVVFNDDSGGGAAAALDRNHQGGGDRNMGVFESEFSVFSFQGERQGYMEEEGFLRPDELCSSLFSEEQAPTFAWYSAAQMD